MGAPDAAVVGAPGAAVVGAPGAAVVGASGAAVVGATFSLAGLAMSHCKVPPYSAMNSAFVYALPSVMSTRRSSPAVNGAPP